MPDGRLLNGINAVENHGFKQRTLPQNNMKALRFTTSQGVWRVAFAFDPERQAILWVAGDKKGKNQKKFYAEIIRKADQRFEGYLKRV